MSDLFRLPKRLINKGFTAGKRLTGSGSAQLLPFLNPL